MEEYDIIIVGSGLAGLTAGARLAREGKRVLVLEQHHTPGGYATTYPRKNYLFEVGLQELDGMDGEDIKRKIFSDLGINDSIEMVPVPRNVHFVLDGKNNLFPESEEGIKKHVQEHYPEDYKGTVRFLKILKKLRSELVRLPLNRAAILLRLPLFPLLYPYLTRHLFTSLEPFLKRNIGNDNLRIMLLGNLFYYHDNPEDLALLYFAAGQGGYCRGSQYIKGGSSRLTGALTDVITSSGGEVITRARVTEILLKDKKVRGVKCRLKNLDKEYYAPLVIYNGAPGNLNDQLKNEYHAQKRVARSIQKREPGMSFSQINIAFSKPLKYNGVITYKTFVNEAGKDFQSFKGSIEADYDQRPFIFTDYGQIDSGLHPRGASYGVILIPERMSHWKDLSVEEYKKEKERMTQLILSRLEKIYPGLKNTIKFHETATPRTMERYTLNPQGAIYGFSQKPTGAGLFRLPVKSGIRGLFYASAWTYPGGGFTGAIWSGWSCASEVQRFTK